MTRDINNYIILKSLLIEDRLTGYFQVMERAMTRSWREAWQCHGKNHDKVMEGSMTMSWEGL